MKHIKTILSALAAVGLMFVGAAQGEMIARAEEGDTAEKPILAITPTNKNFGTLQPGETYTDSFNVRNKGGGTLKYKVNVRPYSVKSGDYEINYNDETKYNDIVKWIVVDKDEGEAEAGQDDPINYTVMVPEDAHGGAQAAVITVTLENATDGDISTTHELGYLVYGNVDGDLIKQTKILENKVPSFMFNPPIKATSKVENTGNVYAVASYTLEVTSFLGGAKAYTNAEAPDRILIFPETERDYEVRWSEAPKLGLFNVKQTVKLLDEEVVTEKLVFICPMWFLITILVLVGVMVFWLVQRARKRGREKKSRNVR